MTDSDNSIIEIITFNNELYEPFNKITERFEVEMKNETINFTGLNDNKYRKCPYCGRIWCKIGGSNTIKCGYNAKIHDIFFGGYKNYVVKFNGENFIIKTFLNESKDSRLCCPFFGLTQEEKNRNKNTSSKYQIIPEGCGRNLNWNLLEDVTNQVQKLLNKTYAEQTYDLKMKEKISEFNINI